MALEDAIAKLTAAVEANTAALTAGGGGGGAAASTGTKASGGGRGKGKAAAETKFTADQVRDTLIKVKDEVGEDEAKRIISDVGGYEKLAQLVADPSKFDAVMAEAETALEGNGDGDGGL